MLEWPCEQRSRGRDPFQLAAVVAEADDQAARPRLAERLEQDVDALVVEQLAEVENGRLFAFEPGRKPPGVALVGKALLLVAGIRRIAASLVQQALEGLGPRLRPELVDVD